MSILAPLPDLMLEPIVRATLAEDLGRAGDVTSDALIPADRLWTARLTTRQAGVVAGLDLARLAFRLMDPEAVFTINSVDGSAIAAGDVLATVRGRARALLAAERTALNFLCRLSGIATATRQLVEAVKPHKARIGDTRKTTPGLRALEKYAVRAGGGVNHRFGLDDAMLIKDNHIAVAGGVTAAVTAARKAAGHMLKIEVEVDSLAQLRELLALPAALAPDAVLLDNMNAATLREAVDLIGGRFVTEASGRVTVGTVAALAATGVDLISSGWLTHSAPILDIGLDEG